MVLENENQRQQYEKCLDEIANQVVQALMGQKVNNMKQSNCVLEKKASPNVVLLILLFVSTQSLREECAKLQRRVLDLEHQNRQLNSMFQQRIKFASDSVLQVNPQSCTNSIIVFHVSLSPNCTDICKSKA